MAFLIFFSGRSLSHGIHHNNHHATITSQTSMVASSSHLSKVHIPGKQLSLRLRKGQIDKAHKDKTAKTFPENFSVTLFLVKPPEDQSDTLIDYSLYTQAMMSSNMNNHSTITATGKDPKKFPDSGSGFSIRTLYFGLMYK